MLALVLYLNGIEWKGRRLGITCIKARFALYGSGSIYINTIFPTVGPDQNNLQGTALPQLTLLLFNTFTVFNFSVVQAYNEH